MKNKFNKSKRILRHPEEKIIQIKKVLLYIAQANIKINHKVWRKI
jgi:hypothetical protein